MEPQEKQEPYNISIRFYKELAMNNQTTKCSIIAPIASITEFDFDSFGDPSNDLSFEVELHRENVEVIKVAATKYLEECLLGGYHKDLGFKDTNLYLYKQRMTEQREGSALEMLISQNILFKEQTKKDIYSLLKEEQSLTRFLKQIPQVFGVTVGKELTFIIYQILKEKKQKYKQIVASPSSIIPRFNCFQGFENQVFQQHYGQCPIYEEINVQEVASFADKDVEEIAKNLYFGDTYIKILNLKQIIAQCNPKADLIKQFTNLVKQISKSVFLTLAGATDPLQTQTSLFDLSKEISGAQFSEIGMPANKSLVRPPAQYSKEQAYGSISKKVKL